MLACEAAPGGNAGIYFWQTALLSGIGKPKVKRAPAWRLADDADFPAKPAMLRGLAHPPQRKSDQDVADLRRWELPRLNRFSNPRPHSEA